MSGDGVTGSAASLSEDHFPAFFEQVHGWTPFPWQRSLLSKVLEQGWPALIDVPTGLGKTAVLDVAVFAYALRSEHARRRVFLVVDRRLIVDQSHEHAICIQRALAEAGPGTVCHAVKQNLASDGDGGPVLDVVRMRGGVNWSWLWLERPDRHAIVTGTVDQVGSRMLFRGYGAGDRMMPMDAALVGTDSIVIVDEAHLSDAFLSTMRDIRELETASTVPAPVVVAMSASPGDEGAGTHRISTADEQDPIAGQRLRAPKKLHLVTVPAAKNAAASAVADALTYWGLQLGGPGRVTGVVVNTVAMARKVFSRLQSELADSGECVLLTGRIRPVDREYLQQAWYPRIRAGADRVTGTALYVVATQTIEVGADIDLDVLVTESASIAALIQRLGRVNRRGGRAGAAVVVHADRLPDAIYGSARQETWQWLVSICAPLRHHAGRSLDDLGDGSDASPVALSHQVRGIPTSQREAMRGDRPYAPLVTATNLDTWARTSPRPVPDIPVAPYLHGIGAGEPTVAVVWRADIHGDDPEQWRRSTVRLPPNTGEAIELPIGAVRRWLAGIHPAAAGGAGRFRDVPPAWSAVSDLESQASPSPGGGGSNDGTPPGVILRVLRYRSADDCEAIASQQVRPGDLLVVPARWGGCDRYGWNPESTVPVTDVADLTGGARRQVVAVRVGAVLATAIRAVAPSLAEPIEQLMSRIIADIEDDAPDDAAYKDILRQTVAAQPDGASYSLPHERVLRSLGDTGRLRILEGDAADDEVAALLTGGGTAWNDDSGALGTSANARPMTLTGHQAAVRKRAEEFARNLGLPAPLVQAAGLAAAYHDEGKRDPRFQVMLHRGDRWLAKAARVPLAKSGMDPTDRAALRLAQQLSGYPGAMRHEALSARIAVVLLAHDADHTWASVAGHDAVKSSTVHEGSWSGAGAVADVDTELVIHLVASHHGYGRPLLPPIADPSPVTVEVALDDGSHVGLNTGETVDWHSPQRFAILCARYGRWGLALLEAVVRLADIWCSARWEEQS